MANKFSFHLSSDDRRRSLPNRIIIGLGFNETVRHVALKFLAWVLFHRERIQIDADVQNDAIPYVPDVVELGYDMRPRLWVECGECSPAKLHKLAVKCPEAEIWIVKSSPAEAAALLQTMHKEEFRKDRYGVIALEPGMVDEVCNLLRERNTFHWFRGDFDPPHLQFELNGLWFDHGFEISRH